MNEPLGYIEIDPDRAAQVDRIVAAANTAGDLSHLDGTDPFQVVVWRERRIVLGRFSFGRTVWRRDVVYLGAHEEEGDQSLLCPQAESFTSREDALADGIDHAIYVHNHDCPERPADEVPGSALPLLVFVAGKAVIDERTEAGS